LRAFGRKFAIEAILSVGTNAQRFKFDSVVVEQLTGVRVQDAADVCFSSGGLDVLDRLNTNTKGKTYRGIFSYSQFLGSNSREIAWLVLSHVL